MYQRSLNHWCLGKNPGIAQRFCPTCHEGGVTTAKRRYSWQIRRFRCPQGDLYVRLATNLSRSQKFNEDYFATSVFLRIILPVLITTAITGLLVRYAGTHASAHVMAKSQIFQAVLRTFC